MGRTQKALQRVGVGITATSPRPAMGLLDLILADLQRVVNHAQAHFLAEWCLGSFAFLGIPFWLASPVHAGALDRGIQKFGHESASFLDSQGNPVRILAASHAQGQRALSHLPVVKLWDEQ